MLKLDRFLDKVVVVTGASSGIGLACAKRFAEEGAIVALLGLDENKLLKAQKEVEDCGNRGTATFARVCDVSKPEDVKITVNNIIQRFGYIDVIVNNAGMMIFKSLVDHTEEDWNRVLGVDLLGAFYFTQQAFLHMKHGGTIVNVSSVHAVETTPLVSSYAAAKAALLSLTRSSAIEGKEKKIRVNAVLPGAVDTPMLWENPNIKSGAEVLDISDVGKAKDIAAAILYLASDDASFIHGATLEIDGGRLARL